MKFDALNLKTMTPRIAGFYFFYYATVGAFIPFWSLYLEEKGFGKDAIGYLIAVTMIARIIAPSIWGHLTDSTGKRMWWIRIATLAELIAWLAIFFVPADFMAYLLIMLFFSFFQNAIVPQFEAVTLFWLGAQREKYGHLRLWGSIGFIVTVTGLGFLFDVMSLAFLPVVLAAFAFICFLSALIVHEPSVTTDEPATGDAARFLQRFKEAKIAWFYGAQFVLLLSHAPFYTFYSNYLASYGYSKTTIGVLWSIGVVAEIVLFTQSKKIMRLWSTYWLMFWCFVLTGARWLLVALFPENVSVQVLAQCGHAFSFALFQALAMQFMFSTFKTNQQGRAQAVYSSFWGLGVALGSVVSGYFWDVTGGAFWFMAASVLMVVFVMLWVGLAKQAFAPCPAGSP